jgi:hypothetical protein
VKEERRPGREEKKEPPAEKRFRVGYILKKRGFGKRNAEESPYREKSVALRTTR